MNQNDSQICESFDLMYGPLEISSGSTRISNKEILVNRMKKKGLNLNSFDRYLKHLNCLGTNGKGFN